MIGMILGNRYEILREIGSGGMANVYLAHCRLLNRNVAVKILKSEFVNDKEFLERFNKEAQVAATISSPNIVNVYDVGHDGDIHYIVMEYVDGKTLKQLLKRRGTPRSIVILPSLSSFNILETAIDLPNTTSAPVEIVSINTANIV